MNFKPFSTVEDVAAAYLCCSCGACVSACPHSAIEMIESSGGYCIPAIDQARCTGCGECLAVCAGVSLRADLPDDPFSGDCCGSWVGKALEDSVYENSQSGGAVTAILLALLEEDKICGAVNVVMPAGSPPRPELRISQNREDILAAQGSKYCPVPVVSALKDMKKYDKPVALVCLACHVHGIKNLLERMPGLSTKVGPVIGLICDRVMTLAAIDYLSYRAEIGEQQISTLEYRSKGWRGYPGDVRVTGIDNKEVFLPGTERMRVKDFFTPARCRLCFDKMNILSDVTVGDPWGVENYDKEGGESVVIARTSIGLECVQAAIDRQLLQLREIPYNAVLEGQAIRKKKKEFSSYCMAWSKMNRPLPSHSIRALESLAHRSGYRRRSRLQLLNSIKMDRYKTKEHLIMAVRNRLRRKRIARKITGFLRP